jgi:hypothetical protein
MASYPTDIHPATYILWMLLMASIVTNFVQHSQIKRLDKELAPVIIRQNIEVFTQPLEDRII